MEHSYLKEIYVTNFQIRFSKEIFHMIVAVHTTFPGMYYIS